MFRPKIFLAALRAAGRSVGRAESESRDFKKMGRSVRTQSVLSTYHSQPYSSENELTRAYWASAGSWIRQRATELPIIARLAWVGSKHN